MRTTTVILCAIVCLTGAVAAQVPNPNDIAIICVNDLAAPEWQLNSLEASLKLSGIPGNLVPAILSVPTNTTVTMTVESLLLQQSYDICIAGAPMVMATTGGMRIGRQIVNLDLRNLDLVVFLNSGTMFANLQPYHGNLAIPVDSGAVPGTGSAQMIIVDPASPEGFVLSQGVQIDVVPAGG